MARGKKIWAQVQAFGMALTAKLRQVFEALPKEQRPKIAIALVVVFVAGTGALGYWLIGRGSGADDVASFVESCIPGATQNYLAEGIDIDQAETKATEFCQCVGTTVSETVTPEVFAEVTRTRKMTNALVLAIGTAAQTCQKN